MSASPAARQAARDQIAFWCWMLPALAILIPVFVAPLLRLARNSFNYDDPSGVMKPAFIGENYVKALTDPYFMTVFSNTLLVGIGVGLLCVAIAYPFAHFLVQIGRAHV